MISLFIVKRQIMIMRESEFLDCRIGGDDATTY